LAVLRDAAALSAATAPVALKAVLLTVSPACEKRAALPGPTPPTRSTRSFQSLKAPALRASRILPDSPGPMPLTVSNSARLALLASTAA
jgi:hypothetical protein